MCPHGCGAIDVCGVCYGGNGCGRMHPNMTVDCHGDCNGTAYMDTCNTCAGGRTNHTACRRQDHQTDDGSETSTLAANEELLKTGGSVSCTYNVVLSLMS